MPQVRKATTADVTALGGALARAFHDDPVMTYLFPESRRGARLEKFFAYEVASMLKHDEVWTADGAPAAAIWAPPGKWRQPLGDVLRAIPTLTPTFSTRLVRALRALAAIEKVHPREPHYYLAALGTDPAAQGKGLGSAVLTPVLERCDRECIGAYLESSKERNIPFYRRHGFDVMSELPLPAGGPPVWPMWRDPRSA